MQVPGDALKLFQRIVLLLFRICHHGQAECGDLVPGACSLIRVEPGDHAARRPSTPGRPTPRGRRFIVHAAVVAHPPD
jgi:hypothetical protein